MTKKDAIKRCEIIDAEMGWEVGLALGKMNYLWENAQEGKGKSVVRRGQIIQWARVKPEDADKFIAICCLKSVTEDDDHVHFLEPRGEDRYYIVGNPEEIERLRKIREQRSSAGKASADARKAKTGSAVPGGATNAPNGTEDLTTVRTETERPVERVVERPVEPSFERPPNASALALAYALASESPSPPSEECPDSDSNLDSDSDLNPTGPVPSFSADDMRLASWMQKAIQTHNPQARRIRGAKLDRWANEFRLMRERDEIPFEEIADTVCWLFDAEHPDFDSDPFWRVNIQSPAKFREKWDQLTAKRNNPKVQPQRRDF